jgi:molecular chaperone DnaK
VKDAEAHADEDRRKRDEAEVRNNADSLVYQTENLLKEQGDKVGADDKTKIEDALKRLKDAIAGPDVEAVKAAHQGLLDASLEFSRRLYESVQAQQAAGGTTPPPGDASDAPSDDEVADAEIVDDDEQSA